KMVSIFPKWMFPPRCDLSQNSGGTRCERNWNLWLERRLTCASSRRSAFNFEIHLPTGEGFVRLHFANRSLRDPALKGETMKDNPLVEDLSRRKFLSGLGGLAATCFFETSCSSATEPGR